MDIRLSKPYIVGVEDVIHMVIGTESEIVEFKLTTGERKAAAEALAAMLNKHRKGTIYFGIDDGGYIKGQQISDSTKRDIAATIAELIEPKVTPTIEAVNIDGKDVIRVTAAGLSRPYSVGGKYLIRVGTENRLMGQEDLRLLLQNDDYSSKWEEELTDHKPAEIDERAFVDFYKSATSAGRLRADEYDRDKLLGNLGLLRDGFLTNGAYALFGKEAKIGLKLATYATESKVTFLDLQLLSGNIYGLIEAAVSYILGRLNWRIEFGTVKRREIPEIPSEAIREIVVNAFAHTDYASLPEIEVNIHPGKVEIYSPGSFPYDLTPYDFIKESLPSFKRNRAILDILFRSKDVEKSGTGFQRVDALCRESGVVWTYRKVAYGFFFEFARPSFRRNMEAASPGASEAAVLDFLRKKGSLGKEELSRLLGKSEKTVSRALSSLAEKGLVEKTGPGRPSRWRIRED